MSRELRADSIVFRKIICDTHVTPSSQPARPTQSNQIARGCHDEGNLPRRLVRRPVQLKDDVVPDSADVVRHFRDGRVPECNRLVSDESEGLMLQEV